MVQSLANPPMTDAAGRVWLVEKGGRVFARLEDARWADMFWVAYRVVDLTETAEDRALLNSKRFWFEDPLPAFRHIPTGARCETAFSGGVIPTPEAPFVIMRALHPPAEPPPPPAAGFFPRLAAWARRLFGKTR